MHDIRLVVNAALASKLESLGMIDCWRALIALPCARLWRDFPGIAKRAGIAGDRKTYPPSAIRTAAPIGPSLLHTVP